MFEEPLRSLLRANIGETVLVCLIKEQGGKENRNEQASDQWFSLDRGGRGTERRRAKRDEAQCSGPHGRRRNAAQPGSKTTRQTAHLLGRLQQKVLATADAASGTGAIGALLRREGLYCSHLTHWWQERSAGITQGLTPRTRGPKPQVDPSAKELQYLRCENDRLIERLRKAIHADNGSSMTSKPVAFLLSDLGITKTHSRPHVSHDNPYSESQFRTLKYRPTFPDRFDCIEDARAFAVKFFHWYNEEHHHSGISLLTPSVLHHGLAPRIIEKRQAVLDAAYIVHPQRFVKRPPKSHPAPTTVWINKPTTTIDDPQ